MVGLGETPSEVEQTLRDLRAVGVEMVNIGQYLQPTKSQQAVVRYWQPAEFEALKELAVSIGFLHCEAGPFVRSSYHAGEQLDALLKRRRGAAAESAVESASG
jgi:lipoic acid synthetase